MTADGGRARAGRRRTAASALALALALGWSAGPAAAGPDELLSAAARMLKAGRAAAALALYRDAYAAGGGDAEALDGIGESLLALGRPELAEPILARAAGGARADWRAHYAWGRALLQMGRHADAEAAFAVAAEAGGGARALAAQAVARDARGDHDGAMALFAAAVDRAPQDAAARANLALAWALHGEAGDALSAFRVLVEEGAGDVVVRHNLALALLLAGDEDRAAAVLRIDLDESATRATLRFFQRLRALEPAARVRALIAATRPMSRAPSDAAVPDIADDPQKRAMVKALLAEPEPAPPPPPPPPAPEPQQVDLPPLLDPTGWSVQIAAYRTPEQLKRGQAYYWKRFAEVLKDYEPRRSEIDYGPRKTAPRGFFYRLNVGGLQDREAAEELCRRLKAAGAPCWVRPPEPAEGRLPASGTGKR